MELTKGTSHNNRFDKEIFTFTTLGEETNESYSEMEITLEEGGTAGADALFHRHPKAAEIFTVTEGKIEVFRDGVSHEIGVDETITVPPNTPHFFKNAAAAVSKVMVRFEPAQDHDLFFANFSAWREEHPEWFGSQGKVPLYLMAKLSVKFPNHMYVNYLPIVLQKMIFRAVYQIGKLYYDEQYGAFKYL